MDKLFSLSISGRIILDMHSLNNEGGEGNQTFSREVTVIIKDKEGQPIRASVNAISGDMLKHIQSEHLYMLAQSENLELCDGCKYFDPNRISLDKEWAKTFTKDVADSKLIDKMIERCVIDDTQGILLTNVELKEGKKNMNLARKSAVEFGWLVGIPEMVEGDNYFHIKLTPGSVEKGSGEASNVGQNIFYRPANSGAYALVLNIDLYKVGYNQLSKTYPLEDKNIEKRYKALLKSILNTFIQPKGAMRNTQNPHIVNFEGVISTSSSTVPSPTVSALNPEYVQEIGKITENLNKVFNNCIKTEKFASLSDFTEIMEQIINNTKPYKLESSKQPVSV